MAKHAVELCPTKTTCSNIGSQHDGTLVLLELSQHPVPLLLTLVPMNGQSRPPIHPQLPSDLQCSVETTVRASKLQASEVSSSHAPPDPTMH